MSRTFDPDSCLSLFLAEKRYEGVRDVTIRGYRYAISRFIREAAPDDVRQIAPEHLFAWAETMRERGLKPGGIRSYQCSVWTWLHWLHRGGHIKVDLASRVKRVRVRPEDKKRRTASEQVKADLIESAIGHRDRPREARYRNVALIEVLWSSGIRRSELATVQLGDVNLVSGTIYVGRTKMGRPRTVAIGRAACLAIEQYIHHERKRYPGALFMQRQGLPMSSNAIRCMLRSLARSAGVEATSHDFRRACAARLLRAGVEADNVARQLGHRSLTMSLMYGEEGRDERAIDAFHRADHGVRRTG